jgi:hypothetical protein
MRSRSGRWGIPVAALAFLLMAGCSVNDTFVYKPSAPGAGVRKLPVKVAVLAFKDGTEGFTRRKIPLPPPKKYTYEYNLAKVGIGGQITSLPPEFWAKGLADEMAASGAFRSVRFLYDPDEMVDEDFYIEGTVQKANATHNDARESEYALVFRARRRTDKRPVWEKTVTRARKTSMNIYDGCGTSFQCYADRVHADTNKEMQGIFAEAATDLMGTLAPLSGNPPESDAIPHGASPTPQAPESVEQTIDKLLRAK